jgi:hypothetical protein
MGHARKGVAGAGVNGKAVVAKASGGKGGRVTGKAGVAEAPEHGDSSCPCPEGKRGPYLNNT